MPHSSIHDFNILGLLENILKIANVPPSVMKYLYLLTICQVSMEVLLKKLSIYLFAKDWFENLKYDFTKPGYQFMQNNIIFEK